MKIHTFRLKNKEIAPNVHVSLDGKYPLYAFTDDEKIAKRFMKERNQDEFLYIPIKKDAEIIEEWQHVHTSQMLRETSLETFIHKNTNAQDARYVPLVMTDGEIDWVLNSIDSFSIVHKFTRYISPTVFTDDFYEVLKYLGYVDMARFHESMTITELPSGLITEPISEDVDLDFIGSMPIRFDQLGTFIMLYGDMLTPDFYQKLEYHREPPQSNKKK